MSKLEYRIVKKGSPYDLSCFAWVCSKCGLKPFPKYSAKLGERYCNCNKK